MATPMTADQIIAALKKFGVKYVEHPGWRTNNRNHKGSWGPVNGVMIHHTAGVFDGIVDYCFNGSAELPGPLCLGVIDKKGVVHLVGNGRANHAGGGDPDVLAAVVREDAVLPATHEHQGSDGAVDGNAHFYGFECVNKGDGSDPWPAAQLTAMQKASAAIAKHHGWSERSVIRHKDWSDYKNDPRGVDWAKFQTAVAKYLAGTSTTPAPDPDPTPVPSGKPVVHLSRLIAAAGHDPVQGSASRYADEVKIYEQALSRLGLLDPDYADGGFGEATVAATRKLQIKLGYSGDAADGIPGKASATWLSLKTQSFTLDD